MWWRSAIIYQIYLRSFFDADGDGVGDIAGVISKLGYLERLGIDAIWLSPVNASANQDWGYDVTDYYAVDPSLGSMRDLEELIHQADKRGMRIIFDLVPNHTSTSHPWFVEASSSMSNPKHDWYIWSHRRNNWRSVFGGSAWKRNRATGEYYLHTFLPEQADLNWHNQEVQEEFQRIISFWIDRGVAGFRIDVVNLLGKDPKLRDDPVLKRPPTLSLRLFGRRQARSGNGQLGHTILQTWRWLADRPKGRRLLLGETMVYSVREVARYYGNGDELDLAFNYPFWLAPWKASKLKSVVAETERSLQGIGWPAYAASNHDIVRAATRWGKNDPRRIRQIMLLLLSLRGTPVIYYGEELGMDEVSVPRRRFRDRYGIRFWPFFRGRDGARTPMVWNERRPTHGFSKVRESSKVWLPFSTRTTSVEAQLHDGASMLNWTQSLIRLRRTTEDLTQGDYHELPSPKEVWAFQRGKSTIVVLNMSPKTATYSTTHASDITPGHHPRTGNEWTLGAWGCLILRLV